MVSDLELGDNLDKEEKEIVSKDNQTFEHEFNDYKTFELINGGLLWMKNSRAEVQKKQKTQTQTQTLFSKLVIKGFRPYTETQKSHRQGGQLFPLVCFR